MLKSTNGSSDMLKDSPFIDELDHIIHCFDKTTKMRFKNKDGSQYIKFGSPRDNDAGLNIRAGAIKLEGSAKGFSLVVNESQCLLTPRSDVADFFNPSVVRIIQAVLDQRSTARNNIIVCQMSSTPPVIVIEHSQYSTSSLLEVSLRVIGCMSRFPVS